MDKIITSLGTFFLGLFIILIIVFILALPTMLLWNAIITDIFNLKEITFWQALGINLLSSLLLGNKQNQNNKGK
jgi:Ca2+/H+ antiporter, TMEM165/GDT1 family